MLSGGSPWTAVVRRVSASVLLNYVYAEWQAFAAQCTAQGISLQDWKETDLTKALQARLSSAALTGNQPFDGDFIAEHERYEIDPTTCKPVCVSRTDLEWLLAGFPRFTIEFKLLDGTPQLRTRYWRDGLSRFVAGTYAPQSGEAAMWAFLRLPGHADGIKVRALLAKRATQLVCAIPSAPFLEPSSMANGLALFDTTHLRSVGPSPVTLAHIFTPLP